MRDRTRPIHMIVDCDPGHDDALALLLANHLAEVVGVTTVSGNASLAAVTRNALGISELMGGQVPVHAGAPGPLVFPENGSPPHATHVHGENGLGGVLLPAPTRAVAGNDAVAFLREASRKVSDLWLVAIGPLTNVAQAIRQDDGFAGRLAGISIMGGSSRGGNVTAAAEFNIWADPEAADEVFRSGARIRLCGLNLTRQLKTSPALLSRIEALDTIRGQLAADVIGYLHQRMETLTGERAAALHDPCAVLAVTHPELFEFQSLPIAVALNDPLTRGMTVLDERYSGRHGPHQVEMALSLDSAAAFELLLDCLAETPD